MKLLPDMPGLRRLDAWKAAQWALAIAVRRSDSRICHLSFQGDHIHLLVEAETRRALARGMQGFQISLAKQLNKRLSRRGKVFADRYHADVLDTPRRVRSALNSVLNNWRKHGVDLGAGVALDPFATGHQFTGWKELQDKRLLPAGITLLKVSHPTTWLLDFGWKRYGLISMREVPGGRDEVAEP